MSKKSIAQKLLIKPNLRVAVLNAPEGYTSRIVDLPAGADLLEKATLPLDVTQLSAANRQKLENDLPRLVSLLTPKTILWVTYLKGTSKTKSDINCDTIAAYANTIGLQAVAICSIDEDWSALRLRIA